VCSCRRLWGTVAQQAVDGFARAALRWRVAVAEVDQGT
jgi:hypothetical protein